MTRIHEENFDGRFDDQSDSQRSVSRERTDDDYGSRGQRDHSRRRTRGLPLPLRSFREQAVLRRDAQSYRIRRGGGGGQGKLTLPIRDSRVKIRALAAMAAQVFVATTAAQT